MLPAEIDGSEVRKLRNQTTGADLHVIASRGLVFSCWRFTPPELAMVAAGKPVWVVMRGEVVPEFNLTVGDRSHVIPPEIIRRARQTEAVLKSPEAETLRTANRRKELLVEVVAWVFLAAGGAMALLTIWLFWGITRG